MREFLARHTSEQEAERIRASLPAQETQPIKKQRLMPPALPLEIRNVAEELNACGFGTHCTALAVAENKQTDRVPILNYPPEVANSAMFQRVLKCEASVRGSTLFCCN